MIHTGANEVMLRQDLSNAQMNPCSSVVAPRWIFTQPTPLLIQKGLTATVLQQELQIINNKSADWYYYLLLYNIFISNHR